VVNASGGVRCAWNAVGGGCRMSFLTEISRARPPSPMTIGLKGAQHEQVRAKKKSTYRASHLVAKESFGLNEPSNTEEEMKC